MNFNPDQTLWLRSLAFLAFADSFSGIFLGFYIWQSSHNLSLLLIYHLVMFVTIPIAGSISSFLAEHFTPKLSLGLGLVTNIFVFVSAALFQSVFLSNLPIYGLVSGVAIGLYAISLNQINDALSQDQLERLGSIRSAISGAINLLVPSLAALALVLGIGYPTLFILSAVFYILCIFTLVPIHLSHSTNSNFELGQVLFTTHTNSEKPLLFWAVFTDGIKGGLLWAIGGIFALALVGGVGQWGIYNFLFSLAGILLNLLSAKYFSSHNNKSTIVISSLLFSVACLVLGTNFNFPAFVVYSLGLVIYGAFAGSSYTGAINRLMRQDKSYSSLRSEYFSAIEYPLAIGRIIPLVILLLFQVTQLNNLILGLTTIFIGAIPIITFSILNFSHQWQSAGTKEQQTKSSALQTA